MGAFTITGSVITLGNYKKYRKGELNGKLKYEPNDFRPPVEWYKKMGLTMSLLTENCHTGESVRYPSKKHGRKPGSGTRTERLEIRCTPDLLKVLDALKYKSWACGDGIYSYADFIHFAIREIANGQFHNADSDLEKSLENLDEEANRISF